MDKGMNVEMRSHSPDSAVEVDLADGLPDQHIFVGTDRDISAGVELSRFGGIHLSQLFLSLVVRKLNRLNRYPLLSLRLIVDHPVGGEVVRVRHVGGDELCESVHFSSGPVLLIGHQFNYDTPLNPNSINSAVNPLYIFILPYPKKYHQFQAKSFSISPALTFLLT